MTVETTRHDIVTIQMLRGVAAAMIVFLHLDVHMNRLDYATFDAHWLSSGVDIFFVISGFIMWVSVDRRNGMSARDFLRNRLIRIVPLYWLVTTIVVVVALAAPELLRTTVLQPFHAVASFLFLPARHPVIDGFFPLVIPGWSLNYEMAFYALFAITLALMAGNGSKNSRFFLVGGMLLLLFLIGSWTKEKMSFMSFYANPIILEFISGMLVGVLYQSAMLKPSRLWTASIGLGMLLLWMGGHFGFGSFALTLISATMIVAGAVFVPAPRYNAVARLGDASYALYLTHPLTLSGIALVWGGLEWHGEIGRAAFFLVAAVCTCTVAFAFFELFERPMTLALKANRPKLAAATKQIVR